MLEEETPYHKNKALTFDHNLATDEDNNHLREIDLSLIKKANASVRDEAEEDNDEKCQTGFRLFKKESSSPNL